MEPVRVERAGESDFRFFQSRRKSGQTDGLPLARGTQGKGQVRSRSVRDVQRTLQKLRRYFPVRLFE